MTLELAMNFRRALLPLLFAGCTAYRVAHVTPPPVDALAPAPDGLAKVCVFRDSLVGGALILPVRDNGEVVGATDGNGQFCFMATPGGHTLTTDVSDAGPLVVSLPAGETLFVEHEVHVGTDALVVIPAVRAAELAAALPYGVVDAAPEGQPMPAAVPTATGHRRATRR